MATTERDLLDRLVNPEGVGGQAVLLGAGLTPGVSGVVDAASAYNAAKNMFNVGPNRRDALAFGLSSLGLLPFVSGTTIRVGGDAATRGIASLLENLYHGSPTLFEKFGNPLREGMYGFGNYLTNLRRTAETYAKKHTLRSQSVVHNADEIDLDNPLGYIYDVSVRAPESSFVDYYSRDIASQPEGLRSIYEELGIPDNLQFKYLKNIDSPEPHISRAAGKVGSLVRRSGFERRGGLENLLQSRGVSGIKLNPGNVNPDEKYYVVFNPDLIDVVGKPTPIYPRVINALEGNQPRQFGSIRQLNDYLRKNK